VVLQVQQGTLVVMVLQLQFQEVQQLTLAEVAEQIDVVEVQMILMVVLVVVEKVVGEQDQLLLLKDQVLQEQQTQVVVEAEVKH
jgi:hypothetical protein